MNSKSLILSVILIVQTFNSIKSALLRSERIDFSKLEKVDECPPDKQDDKYAKPALFQTAPAIIANAKRQTKASRNLFYKPNNISLKIIKNAANGMLNLFQSLIADNQWNILIKGVSRSEVCKSDATKYTSKAKSFFDRQIDSLQDNNAFTQLFDVAHSEHPKAKNIIYLFAIMGDLGLALTDFDDNYEKLPNPEDKMKNESYKNVLLAFSQALYSQNSLYKKIGLANLIGISKIVESLRGCSIISPTKKQERIDGPITARSGVLDCNNDHSIDISLNIQKNNRIPFAKWPYQPILKEVLKKASEVDEPLAGHFSGSVVKTMLVIDLTFFKPEIRSRADSLSKDTTQAKVESLESHPLISFLKDANIKPSQQELLRKIKKYVDSNSTGKNLSMNSEKLRFRNLITYNFDGTNLNSDFRRCKAALSAGFYIAIGMHSAAEEYYAVHEYLEPSFNGELARFFEGEEGKSKATNYIVKLMEECTAK